MKDGELTLNIMLSHTDLYHYTENRRKYYSINFWHFFTLSINVSALLPEVLLSSELQSCVVALLTDA